MSFLRELQRRNVHRVALAYAAGAWLLIQVGDTVFPVYDLPAAALPVLITVLAIGFLPALVLSWVFEWTPEGVKRDADVAAESPPPSKWLDRIIVLTLVIAVGYFAIDKFVIDPARDAAIAEAARQEGRADALIESYGDRSIAVLPFVNLSADAEQEYFSDGMSEEILNLLAAVEELRVISRSSAFSFKDKDFKIPEVGKALNVAHVLEGSVRRSGSKIRITAQLIDARTDTHLWSATYDREFDDIFVIQDEIAAAVTEQLRITLLGDTPQAERVDPQAYALYLQARYLFNTFVPANQALAKPLIEQVLAIAPDYVPALILQLRTIISGDDYAASSEFHRLVERIVSIDPGNERANSVRSWVALYVEGDVPSAARFLERAMSRPSTDLEFLRGTSSILKGLGLNAEALAVQAYVVDRDPICGQCRYLLASSYRDAGLFDKAEVMMQSAVDLHPGDSPFAYALARTWLLNGRPQAVLDWLDSVPEEDGDELKALAIMARHDLGGVAEARTAMGELVASWRHNDSQAAAEALAWIGEKDLAFDFLNRLGAGHPFLIAQRSQFFSRVHDDPRWHALLVKHGVSPEQLEALDIRIQLPHGVTIVREQT